MFFNNNNYTNFALGFGNFWFSEMNHSLNLKTMGNLLYLIAVILIILWIFGAFISPFGGNLIHALLVIAIVAILLRVIRGGSL